MKSAQLLEEILETNLTYLMLAQRMLREDRPAAMYRLGISRDVADIIEQLTPGQVSRMAATNTLLCRFRCDDRAILSLLSGYRAEKPMPAAHGSILLAGQPAAAVA
ncbi:MAG TPA: flagellar transcriptional regulator FlhD [Burkholderiales bacterium]|nr:flagellar transcriptional regulator FlhD [Burkholderiales bacterium]